jgi:hypothetical protein
MGSMHSNCCACSVSPKPFTLANLSHIYLDLASPHQAFSKLFDAWSRLDMSAPRHVLEGYPSATDHPPRRLV